MTEAEFQRHLIQDLTDDGAICLKLDPGTGTIPKGWPDLMVLRGKGTVMFVEVKSVGGTVSEQQRRHMLLLALAGYDVCFCDPRPDMCHPRPFTEQEIREYQPPRRA